MTEKRHLVLNKKSVEAAPVPTDKPREIYHDTKRPGFKLYVTANGNKSFYFAKRVDGEKQRQFLGTHPETKVGKARDLADILAGEIAQGLNPFEEQVTRSGGPTLKEYFDDWLERYAKPHRPGSWKHDQELFEKHIEPAMGSKRLKRINQARVRALHGKMGKGGKGQRRANAMLQLVSTMWNVAKTWKMVAGDNPVVGIKKYKETKRERYLTQEEAPRFFAALADPKTPTDHRDFCLLALFTGARRGNLMAMRWAHISFKGALWTIPGAETKTDTAYLIPLVPPALQVLIERQRARKDGVEWVFPANSESGHLVNFHRQWVDILKKAKITDLRIHDLRHSLASWQVMAGTSLAVIGKGLGHNSTSTTARYAHVQVDSVRDSMETAVGNLLSAGKAKKNG